jgi:hypothetical protein
MVTSGSQQDLELNPGAYSVDPDEDSFDASVSLNYFSIEQYLRNSENV